MTTAPKNPARALLVTACLALWAACGGPLLAAEGPQDNAAPVAARPPDNVAPAPAGDLAEENAAGPGIADRTHTYIEQGLLYRVIRFDDFFGNVRTESTPQTEYLLRWRNSLRWEEGGDFTFRTYVRAVLRLPQLSQRVNLVLAGESEAEPSPGLPQDPGIPGFDRTLPNTRVVNTELRYAVVRTPGVDLFCGVGVRLVYPPDSFVRTRFLYTHRLGTLSHAHFGETLFWKGSMGFGETTEIELERQLGPDTVLRWSNAGTVAERLHGLEWGSELALLHQLSPRTAVILAGGASGATRPAAVVEDYRIYARYRRNILREWIFFEVEPEISWPRSPRGSYPQAYAATFRIEFVFRGERPREKKPARIRSDHAIPRNP